MRAGRDSIQHYRPAFQVSCRSSSKCRMRRSCAAPADACRSVWEKATHSAMPKGTPRTSRQARRHARPRLPAAPPKCVTWCCAGRSCWRRRSRNRAYRRHSSTKDRVWKCGQCAAVNDGFHERSRAASAGLLGCGDITLRIEPIGGAVGGSHTTPCNVPMDPRLAVTLPRRGTACRPRRSKAYQAAYRPRKPCRASSLPQAAPGRCHILQVHQSENVRWAPARSC